jgi:hypothetical protein
MGCPGLEPGTNRLKAEYSTIELATLAFIGLFIFKLFACFFLIVFQLDHPTTNIYKYVKGLTRKSFRKNLR